MRSAAAQALGMIRDPRAIQPIIGALADSDSAVRRSAVAAIAEFKDCRAIDPLIALLSGPERQMAAAALAKIGPASFEPLLQTLGNVKAAVNFETVAVIGDIGDARAVRFLAALIREDNKLSKIGLESLSRVLKRSLADVLASDLREIARLEKGGQLIFHSEGSAEGMWNPGRYVEELFDCSEVRKLAADELHRRGLGT